jgi:hypothetical protein
MGNKEQENARRLEAYELRLRGKSYRQIAEALGIGNGTAHRWVTEHTSAITLPLVDEIRKQEVDRMMRYLDVLDARIDDGDDKAVVIAIKVSERLAKLLGADMPTQVQVESTDGVSKLDLDIQDLISRQKALNALEKVAAAERRSETEGASDDES